MTPDNGLRSIPECNGEFNYYGNQVGRVKLWMRYNNVAPTHWEGKPNTTNERTYPQWVYNFATNQWFNDGYNNNDSPNYPNTNIIDNFDITSSTSSPNRDQYVDVTVRARDNYTTNRNYRGTVRFKVERKYWSSRIEAPTSNYTLNRTSYTFNANDAGIHQFTNVIKFRNENYEYRLVVYDNTTSTIYWYATYYVNESTNNNYYTNSFYISTNNATPNQYQSVDLSIKARNGSYTDTTYRGKVNFEVQYKWIGQNNRTKTTSLSYYEMKYPYENNGLTFYSSNNGEVTIPNFITFKRKWYEYKVIVRDESNNSIWYQIFTVRDTTSSNTHTENFSITTNNTTPSTNQRINLGIKAQQRTSTNTSYRWTVNFEIYYKASGASTWTKTTSSNYYTMHSNYRNGYTFTAARNGYVTITNFIKFNRNNHSYKVLVYDKNDKNIIGEQIFNVGSTTTNTSNIYWFTTSELTTIEGVYTARNHTIANLKASYPKLRTNSTRLHMSNTLYEEMEKVLSNKSNRKYNNFDSFYSDFLERYRFTVDRR